MIDSQSQVYLIDSHCHLADTAFDGDRVEVIERAREAGVRRILTIGTGESPENNQATVALAERHVELFATVAIHPHEVARAGLGWEDRLEDMWSHDRVVAVGETGLDYYYCHAPAKVQEEAFGFFITAARRFMLPLVVHCRSAFARVIDILEQERAEEVGGVIHCFNGDWQQAKRFFDLNFDISVAGMVTFKKATDLHDVVRRVPLERMLVETDAPYLAPVPNRGKRNEPAFVVETVKQVATLKALSLSEVTRSTMVNTERRFNLAPLESG